MGTLKRQIARDQYDVDAQYEQEIANVKKRRALRQFVLDGADVPDHLDYLQFSEHSLFPGERSIASVEYPHLSYRERIEELGLRRATHPKAPVVKIEIDKHELWRHGIAPDDRPENEDEARELLADIMSYFKVIFGDGRPEWEKRGWKTSSAPATIYTGVGEYNGKRAIIQLKAYWPPRGCELQTVTKEETVLACANGGAS